MFKDMVLFAFSAVEFPTCSASINGGVFTIAYPPPLRSEIEVLDEPLSSLDQYIDMMYVEKETLYIRGEFLFHAKKTRN
jgi:hypothetical protein